MAKKAVAEVSEAPAKVGITPLTTDFGREDLNALRDKLNEVISSL